MAWSGVPEGFSRVFTAEIFGKVFEFSVDPDYEKEFIVETVKRCLTYLASRYGEKVMEYASDDEPLMEDLERKVYTRIKYSTLYEGHPVHAEHALHIITRFPNYENSILGILAPMYASIYLRRSLFWLCPLFHERYEILGVVDRYSESRLFPSWGHKYIIFTLVTKEDLSGLSMDDLKLAGFCDEEHVSIAEDIIDVDGVVMLYDEVWAGAGSTGSALSLFFPFREGLDLVKRCFGKRLGFYEEGMVFMDLLFKYYGVSRDMWGRVSSRRWAVIPYASVEYAVEDGEPILNIWRRVITVFVSRYFPLPMIFTIEQGTYGRDIRAIPNILIRIDNTSLDIDTREIVDMYNYFKAPTLDKYDLAIIHPPPKTMEEIEEILREVENTPTTQETAKIHKVKNHKVLTYKTDRVLTIEHIYNNYLKFWQTPL